MGCQCMQMRTLNGLLRCMFRVLRVSSFNGLYSALTAIPTNIDYRRYAIISQRLARE